MQRDQPHLRVVSKDLTSGVSFADLPDDDLMLLAMSGRHDAFEALVRRHQPLVLGTSVRYLGDEQLAREVAQDVFLALWTERERFQARGKFKSFLLCRTFNRCHVTARSRRNLRRRIDTFATRDESIPTSPASPVETVLAEARAREVRGLLTTLSAPIRQALILRYFDDLSLEETADVMKKPIGTIKSYVFRGLRRLQSFTNKEAP